MQNIIHSFFFFSIITSSIFHLTIVLCIPLASLLPPHKWGTSYFKENKNKSVQANSQKHFLKYMCVIIVLCQSCRVGPTQVQLLAARSNRQKQQYGSSVYIKTSFDITEKPFLLSRIKIVLTIPSMILQNPAIFFFSPIFYIKKLFFIEAQNG